jgi:hypothetical protein
MNKDELLEEITRLQDLIKVQESKRLDKSLSPGDKTSLTTRIRTNKQFLNKLLA